MNCPKCIGKLGKITIRLSEVFKRNEGETSEIELDQCFVCNGVWFDAGELEHYLNKKMVAVDSPAIDSALAKEFDHKIGTCPRCSIEMIQIKHEKASEVLIDQCDKCNGIWLDNTEIDRLENSNRSLSEKISSSFSRLFRKK